MALPVIQYDASSGSDTLASGAGPATAIGGSPNTASVVSGPSNIIQLETGSPFDLFDVTDIETDGSHVIWLDTASGRKLSKITAKTQGTGSAQSTVTVEDTFSFASTVNFAIGGKRQTLESASGQHDYTDFKEGWTIEFASGTYDVTAQWTLPASSTSGSGFEIRAASGYTTKPVIRKASTSATFSMLIIGHRTRIFNMRFQNNSTSNNTQNAILRNTAEVNGVIAQGCDFICDRSSTTNGGIGYRNENSVGTSGIFIGCYFEGGIFGIYWVGGRCNISLVNCRFHSNHRGVRADIAGNNGSLKVDHCIFDKNENMGAWIALQNTWSVHIRNCTFYNNTNSIVVNSNNTRFFEVTHCIFTNNSSRGIWNNGSGTARHYGNYNVFHLNTTADNSFPVAQWIGDDGSVFGTSPQMADPANGDFSIPHDSVAANIDEIGRYAGARIPDPAPGGGTPQSVGYAFG